MIDLIYWGTGILVLLWIVWWPGYTREEIIRDSLAARADSVGTKQTKGGTEHAQHVRSYLE